MTVLRELLSLVVAIAACAGFVMTLWGLVELMRGGW